MLVLRQHWPKSADVYVNQLIVNSKLAYVECLFSFCKIHYRKSEEQTKILSDDKSPDDKFQRGIFRENVFSAFSPVMCKERYHYNTKYYKRTLAITKKKTSFKNAKAL